MITTAHGYAGGALVAGLLPGLHAAEQPTSSTSQAVGYPTLFLLVALGSVVLIVPTSVVVSAAGVVAWHADAWYSPLFVPLVAATAALCGDSILYWLASRGGGRWLTRLRQQVDTPRLQAAQHRLGQHGATVLVIGRLIPGGKVPVMLACLLSKWSVRRYARADMPATLAWATCYAAIGVLGGSLFPEPWQGVLTAIGLALLISLIPGVWRRVRRPGARDRTPQPARD